MTSKLCANLKRNSKLTMAYKLEGTEITVF